MPMKHHKIILITILILAVCLRFFNINSYPSLNPDEAALGYNAYSLLKTGHDEHGARWPIHFRSFDDYKPGGYIYLTLPSIAIFGLNPFATRLPNLIMSILAIYFLYRLVLTITKSQKISLLSAFVLTISPWHIHFSRGAWESQTALSFIIIGTYYFYLFKNNKKTSDLILYTFYFILSTYFYHSARILAPALFLYLVATSYQLLITNRKKLLFPFIFGLLLAIPVLYSFLTSGGSARFSGVGLTADTGPLSRSEELLNQHQPFNLYHRLIHNRRLLYFLSWSEKYASHFNLNFLFVDGDQVPRSKSPDMGQLYLIEFPLLLFGLYHLINSSKYKKLKQLLLPWLFLAPLASSLTFQAPSALRALPMVIPSSILIAIAIKQFVNTKIIKFFFITFYFINFIYYLDSYFIHMIKRFPFAWNSSFDQMVPYLESQKTNYQHIYVTNKYDQPYILYLFYSKYPPQQIQSQIKLIPQSFGFSTVEQIDNITFKIPNQIPNNSLIIASDETIGGNPIKTINFPSGTEAFKIYNR